MNNFIVIFLCLFAGVFCKKLQHFRGNTAQVLNSYIIFLSLPALVLSTVPKLFFAVDVTGNWWVPVSMAWINFTISFLVVSALARKYNWSNAKKGALILTAGLGNTSFVGFPILEAILGKDAIPVGVLADQPGSFLVLSTLGIVVAASCSGAKFDVRFVAGKVFKFPPFLALLLSFVWAKTGLHAFELLSVPLEKIASTLVPLALFSVGHQMSFDLKVIHKRWRALAFGLSYKLLICPIIFYFLYIKILNLHDLFSQVTVLESAMATMITSAVVANEFHLDGEIANLMVGLSIPLSLVTVPLWNLFLFK